MRALDFCIQFCCHGTAHVRPFGRYITLMLCPFFICRICPILILSITKVADFVNFKGFTLFINMFCHAFWPTYGSLFPHVPIFTLEHILYSDILICSWRGKFQLGCVRWRSLHVCMFQIWFWVSLFLSQFQNHPNPSLQINIFIIYKLLMHARVCAWVIHISNLMLSLFLLLIILKTHKAKPPKVRVEGT